MKSYYASLKLQMVICNTCFETLNGISRQISTRTSIRNKKAELDGFLKPNADLKRLLTMDSDIG